MLNAGEHNSKTTTGFSEENLSLVKFQLHDKMSKLFIYMSCLLAMVCHVQSRTKTSVCAIERVQLRREVASSMNQLTNIGRKEMPSFYTKGLKCRGYIQREPPIPTKLLRSSPRNFLGSKFLPQIYKIFRPFMDVSADILNGSIAVPTKAPEIQLWNVKTFVMQLVVCLYPKIPSSSPKYLPVKYNAELHRMDVKRCLVNAGMKATPRRVQIVQYYEVFEELYKAVIGVSNIASHIKYYKLK